MNDREWMIQWGEGLHFTLKARESISILHKRPGQDLDRDVTIQLRRRRACIPVEPALVALVE